MAENIRTKEIVRSVLAADRCGLLTDIDGTISPIAEAPDKAFVDPEAKQQLNDLSKQITLVAAISGRAAIDAKRMVSLDELVYSGNHGMEWWRAGRLEQSKLAREFMPQINGVLDTLKKQIQIPGVRIENKGLTASIHVRETSDPESSEASVIEAASNLADPLGLVITRGRMVVEIRPPVDLNKGSAVQDLVEAFELTGAIYIGDDVTDIDAFNALRRLRESTNEPYYAIAVDSAETAREVVTAADGSVHGIAGVVDLLAFAASISRSSRSRGLHDT